MFTGIVETLGQISSIETRGEDWRLYITADDIPWDQVAIGDSISVSGACLTVVAKPTNGFAADVSQETLDCTRFAELQIGDTVNLERALTLATPLGGHLVTGHVDGLVQIMSISHEARSIRYQIQLPNKLKHYVASKGSVCLDGISLTVNSVNDCIFDVNLIPHTQAATTAKNWSVGLMLHYEVDLIARYLERFAQTGHMQSTLS